MSHAERCPVCYGKGVVWGVAETGAYPTATCYGCNGKGWVEVNDPQQVTSWFSDKCPVCGGDRSSPDLAGCPIGSHYVAYPEV